MKVICINASAEEGDFKTGLLKENSVYSILFECLVAGKNGKTRKGYALHEFGKYSGFGQRRFIPLSDIDENQLKEERELEPIKTH